jgi:hypothetical protein
MRWHAKGNAHGPMWATLLTPGLRTGLHIRAVGVVVGVRTTHLPHTEGIWNRSVPQLGPFHAGPHITHYLRLRRSVCGFSAHVLSTRVRPRPSHSLFCFRPFVVFLHANSGIVPPTGHHRVLPNLFPFITHGTMRRYTRLQTDICVQYP